jgi:hypothetical protein
MDQNPYSVSPELSNAIQSHASDAESIRRTYLSHEASVKSIGTLYYLGGFFGLIISTIYTVGGVYAIVNPPTNESEVRAMGGFMLVLGIVLLGFSCLQLWSAWGVRRLDPKARIGASIVALFGLLGIPLGTLISAYFLYLLLSKKGSYVFSDAYKEVIAQTPHIRYKTSCLVWVLLVLLLSVVIIAIAALGVR